MSILHGVEDVLRLFLGDRSEIGFTDVVEHLALPKSSASRLLAQMTRYNLLEFQPSTRRYRPGVLLLELGQHYSRSHPLIEEVRTLMAHLSYETGHTAYISMLDGTDTVVLQRISGSHPVQVVSQPGARRPAFTTAMGRVLLARLSEEQFATRYGKRGAKPLPEPPPGCPRTVAELRERVVQARHEHGAIAINEGMPGIGAVATTVADPASGEVVGVCLSFTAMQVSEREGEAMRTGLVEAVAELGRRIGDPYWQSTRSATTGKRASAARKQVVTPIKEGKRGTAAAQ